MVELVSTLFTVWDCETVDGTFPLTAVSMAASIFVVELSCTDDVDSIVAVPPDTGSVGGSTTGGSTTGVSVGAALGQYVE